MKSLYIMTGVIALVAILTLPQALGLDAEPMDSDTDAQKAAQRQAAEDRCTAMYGSAAMFFEAKGGHLVCRDGGWK